MADEKVRKMYVVQRKKEDQQEQDILVREMQALREKNARLSERLLELKLKLQTVSHLLGED